MVLGQGLALTGAGLTIGLAIALGVGCFTASLLYGISGMDLLTFVTVTAVLLAAAIIAILVPAFRTSDSATKIVNRSNSMIPFMF
jgi:putative ABC transport system permease protein